MIKNILTSFCSSLGNFDTVTSAVIFTPLKKSHKRSLYFDTKRFTQSVIAEKYMTGAHVELTAPFSFSTALLLTSRHMHCRKTQLQPLRAVRLHAYIHTTTRGQDRIITACLALLVVSWMWGASTQGTAAVSAVRTHSISWFMSIHLSSQKWQLVKR